MSRLLPQLAEEEYGFATIPMGRNWPDGLVPLATFAEDEGASIIATVAAFEAAGIECRTGWARISPGLNSELEGVGLTALMSGALAEVGISCNVVAAYHHDHLFVPWERRQEAMQILEEMEFGS